MLKVVALLALVAVAAALPGSEEFWEQPVSTQEGADVINSAQSLWKAHASPRFEGLKMKDAARLCGSVLRGQPGYVELEPYQARREELALEIPTSFDVRTAFTNCTDVTSIINDQSDCGSCWAFGSTEAFSDRLCIAHGRKDVRSEEDTTGCCSFLNCGFSQGCNGGQPSAAWGWFKSTGVVSGGQYGNKKLCSAYSLPPCAHHVNSTKYKPCGSSEYPTPACPSTCASTSGRTFGSDKVQAQSSYSLSSVEDIQRSLMTKGTVTAAFTVYADFPSYRSGVYRHTSGSELGGHAIAIVGWGVENGTPYWTVKNSWNSGWGDQGLFKILRGQNECGIESNVVAGDV